MSEREGLEVEIPDFWWLDTRRSLVHSFLEWIEQSVAWARRFDSSLTRSSVFQFPYFEGMEEIVRAFLGPTVKMTKIKLNLSESLNFPTVHSRNPIFGYRAWYFDKRKGMLTSFNGYEWEGPIVRNNKDPVLFDGGVRGRIDRNLLGFYFAKDPTTLGSLLLPSNYWIGGMSQGWVFNVAGICSLFGRVVEHEFGYRSRYVRVDHLVLITGGTATGIINEVVSALERRYQCTVVKMHDVQKTLSYLKWMKKEIEPETT